MNSLSTLSLIGIRNSNLLKRAFSSSAINNRAWSRLIRFEGSDNKIHYGEPLNVKEIDINNISNLKAKIVKGDIFSKGNEVTNEIIDAKKLLAPIENPPIFLCIGLNYKKHAKGTNHKEPIYPILFIKGTHALNTPDGVIEIPKMATNNQIDYEVELCVVIGKECKNVKKEEALKYVAGYTVGNDISARKWQGNKLGGGPQLVSPEIISDLNTLKLEMKVNDETLQSSNIKDMIFDVPTIISFLSQGHTLVPGTVIMTGTPEGVGFARKLPVWLLDGFKAEAYIEKIGSIKNIVKYLKE
ncbi:fumarylacetoacetate hydrolase family protein [Neocallimastix lanati (nom. inval.)]|uniref:Fumarylacetoacetate hydrolase family protein n=1 Tax=Neocallimastix californiae TaxID=1754190 RepID=A0A1Y2FC28_9FUNG|nr:fumarylacetoacetate hydrolase family protein [Neocallimastix sp. JGI-2020a]ORY81177.1 fumarylacetoacetate hydrolase family protein [Neocallimastix californiae]|eukprot:ORY81177.1 fumarylacetoacetate hydrolase family protein [Neocallimastix californiae]